MLTQVPWQILHAHAQVEIVRDARMPCIEARLRKMPRHRVVRAPPFPVTHEARETR